MACKFHAVSRTVSLPTFTRLARPALIAALGAACLAAQAEKADRDKPVQIEAEEPGTVDLLKQVVVFNGNVVITQGTMTIRAGRVEVRQTPEGFRAATAIGSTAKPANFRQKRDGVDEFIEGEAERLEYDGKADTIRFVTNASVRRLRGTGVADEISGNLVSYDSITEVFSVSGGAPATPANPGGRVRAVLTPREGTAAAAEAASAASPQTTIPCSARRLRTPSRKIW